MMGKRWLCTTNQSRVNLCAGCVSAPAAGLERVPVPCPLGGALGDPGHRRTEFWLVLSPTGSPI